MTPTISTDGFVVTITDIPAGTVVAWGDSRSSVADASGATHDYDAASSTFDRLMPTQTYPGRRFVVMTTADGSDRWRGGVDVACQQDSTS